jgi:hypothetical protein
MMNGLSVTFGSTVGTTTMPGLVITGGQLTSLNMTVNSAFTVGNVSFMAQQLQFTYTAGPPSVFTLSGSVGVSVTNIVGLSVTFGHTKTNSMGASTGFSPGLVIINGALQSLDMTINSNFMIGSVNFGTKNLEFTYNATGSQFTLSGAAFLNISGVTAMPASTVMTSTGTSVINGISVTFGHQVAGGTFTPGLSINSGMLQSLDMTINSNLSIDTVTFMTNQLEFNYNASTNRFSISGSVGVSIQSIVGLSVTFGHAVTNSQGATISFTPGLVIQNGALKSMDMTINANITIGSFQFATRNLEFMYSTSPSAFTIGGAVLLNIGGITGMPSSGSPFVGISVTFGHAVTNHAGATTSFTPGLEISNGVLKTLDMTINTTSHQRRRLHHGIHTWAYDQ